MPDFPPIVRMKIGQYTGDGTTNHPIRGIGFKPKYVKIWHYMTAEGGIASVYATEKEATGFAILHEWNKFEARDNRIISLDPDGFTVSDDGVDVMPNRAGAVYNYIAMTY